MELIRYRADLGGRSWRLIWTEPMQRNLRHDYPDAVMRNGLLGFRI